MTTTESLQKLSLHKGYIFVVDDDIDDRELISDALMENKLNKDQIQLAANGFDLIEKLQQNNTLPRFILLDLNMPKMDGKEVLATLKKSDTFRHIPVIIFSTSDADKDIQDCYQLGCSAYLSKPLDYTSLLDVMQVTLGFWNNVLTKLLSHPLSVSMEPKLNS
ncbi:response regulator [Glaciecola sp. 1036]|uniref:response regulator n=1 Tax=Alteromonadaceae TaxID=72275 RepID=UPI003CFECC57